MLFSTPLNPFRARAAAMRMCAYLSDAESTYKSCVTFLLIPHFAQACTGAVETQLLEVGSIQTDPRSQTSENMGTQGYEARMDT